MSGPGSHGERPAPTKARAVDRGPAGKGRVRGAEIAGLDLAAREGCRRLVCAGFCTFFKPRPEIDDRCGGLAESERLLARAGADPAVRERLGRALAVLIESEEPVSFQWDEPLAELICRTCPFLLHGDCDHRNPDLDPDDRLEPCGGYILLAALADAGVITLRME